MTDRRNDDGNYRMALLTERAESAPEPHRPLLGAHMSIAGGISQALVRGDQAECECVQIFTKSSRQWAAKPYAQEDIAAFQTALVGSRIKLVVAHDSYLVNLGAT